MFSDSFYIQSMPSTDSVDNWASLFISVYNSKSLKTANFLAKKLVTGSCASNVFHEHELFIFLCVSSTGRNNLFTRLSYYTNHSIEQENSAIIQIFLALAFLIQLSFFDMVRCMLWLVLFSEKRKMIILSQLAQNWTE